MPMADSETIYTRVVDAIHKVENRSDVRLVYESSRTGYNTVREGVVTDAELSEYTTVNAKEGTFKIVGTDLAGREKGDVLKNRERVGKFEKLIIE
jgi:hypothetical protein